MKQFVTQRRNFQLDNKNIISTDYKDTIYNGIYNTS